MIALRPPIRHHYHLLVSTKGDPVGSAKRVRLCMKDLFHQDVVEMVERETRKYGIWSIEDPDNPDFDEAYDLLWSAFGPSGEMERKDILEGFIRKGAFQMPGTGTIVRHF